MAVAKTIGVGALIIVLGAAAAGLGAWDVWQRMHEPYRGYGGTEQFVDIPSGASTPAIGRRLADAHVVSDPRIFRAALWWSNRGRALKAGEYRFDQPMTMLEVIDKLARGDVYEHRITFPEGLTIEEMSKLFEKDGFGKASDFLDASTRVERIHNLDPDAKDLEGYLFPETYSLPHNAPAAVLIDAMVDRFKVIYGASLRDEATANGLTTRQVVTLASLVEKETGNPEERPIVAAVYLNRRKIGMAMQADPTVVYVLEKAHRYDGNIRKDDLAIDSPYNTYKYPGLPPGPIASPGKASLEAVLAPADVSYLYFVSRNDGSHVFATTLAEHDRNVKKFQVDYFREQRRLERQQASAATAATSRPTSASRATPRSSRASVR
jgi:UPF0755 protein